MASADKSNPQETVVDGDHEEKDQNQTAEQTEPERTEDETRVRTLTNKGKELIENEVQKYSAKIDKIWNEIFQVKLKTLVTISKHYVLWLPILMTWEKDMKKKIKCFSNTLLEPIHLKAKRSWTPRRLPLTKEKILFRI